MPNDDISPIIETPGTPTIKANGHFVLGTSACFYYYFTDINGLLYDPSDFTVTIKDPSDTVVKTQDSMDKIELGVFAYTWTIPLDWDIGKYTITIDYTVETINGPQSESIVESFVIVEKGPGNFTLRQVASRGFLESLIGTVQRIPVFNEIARFNNAKTVGELTFKQWNQSAGAKVYLNGNLKENGFDVDYLKGKIYFNNALSKYDEVTVDYNFRWFTDQELDDFIEQSVNTVNIWVPQTTYTLFNIPDRWMIATEYGAAINVIRRLLMDLLFQEPAKVFGGLKRASEIFGQLETLKKNYEEMFIKMLEQKKFVPYAGLTRTITTPTFSLPGGRCIKHDVITTYEIDKVDVDMNDLENNVDIIAIYLKDDVLKVSFNTTIENAHELFNQFQNIRVMSNNNGNLSFENIHKIWNSGEKELLKIIDNFGNFVEVSEDHIIFIDGKEKLAKDVIIGDILTVVNDNKIISSNVVSIENSGKHQTYDIEVPSTQNLFANKIQVHNSRWFRMMFSNG